jgi:hypothetical protein
MSVNHALRFVAIFALSFASPILAQNSKTPSHKSLPKDHTLRFEANQIWTDTGLDLGRGDRVDISGTVMACEDPSPSEKAHWPLSSAPAEPFWPGFTRKQLRSSPLSDADLPIVAPSHLYPGPWRERLARSRHHFHESARGVAKPSVDTP